MGGHTGAVTSFRREPRVLYQNSPISVTNKSGISGVKSSTKSVTSQSGGIGRTRDSDPHRHLGTEVFSMCHSTTPGASDGEVST